MATPAVIRLIAKDYNLFPTVITVVEPLDEMSPFLKQINASLSLLKSKHLSSSYEKSSVRNGWRIDNPHDLPEFIELKKHLEYLVYALNKDNRVNLGNSWTTTSWLNVHDSGGFNMPHHHGNSLISGVFYLRVPAGSGRIIFKDPRPGSFFCENAYSASAGEHALQPREGMTVLFPGFVEHYVEQSSFETGPGLRASVAFNVTK